MVDSHTETAQAAIESSFLRRQGSMAGRAAFRRDMDQSRRAIAASREVLKRLRQRKIDEAHGDVEQHRVSAFDADILRKVFQDLVLEMKAPEAQWRDLAQSLVYEFTGCERVETALVDWIIRR
ncbi:MULTISPECIES: hypothetical protein [unclassified Mesorhizobium]|uniref:hypothetical protein n=1 Tax=unclassified Mesorhizobium TaxID=325217 RepID=UPI001CC9D9A7|nr:MULTISPECIES: hypothetical protein [unclassified Mesorhizobium]MBZ9739833.1 hypothetical protein [Mesorhizobium sp. CO1-1-4]MBZ9805644.1 hypothetical protein [Mesorhizobium sp. ES1-6]